MTEFLKRSIYNGGKAKVLTIPEYILQRENWEKGVDIYYEKGKMVIMFKEKEGDKC